MITVNVDHETNSKKEWGEEKIVDLIFAHIESSPRFVEFSVVADGEILFTILESDSMLISISEEEGVMAYDPYAKGNRTIQGIEKFVSVHTCGSTFTKVEIAECDIRIKVSLL